MHLFLNVSKLFTCIKGILEKMWSFGIFFIYAFFLFVVS